MTTPTSVVLTCVSVRLFFCVCEHAGNESRGVTGLRGKAGYRRVVRADLARRRFSGGACCVSTSKSAMRCSWNIIAGRTAASDKVCLVCLRSPCLGGVRVTVRPEPVCPALLRERCLAASTATLLRPPVGRVLSSGVFADSVHVKRERLNVGGDCCFLCRGTYPRGGLARNRA